MNDTNEQNKAVELLNIAAQHPASYFETKEKARKLLSELNIDASIQDGSENHYAIDWKTLAAEMIEYFSN